MNKIKKIFTSKKFTYGSVSFIMALAVTGILLIINLFVSGLDLKYDLTKDKLYSISADSKNYLKTIKQQVNMIVFTSGEPQAEFKNIFEEYKRYCPNIKISYEDPDKSPELANKYMGTDGNPAANADIIIEKGTKWKKINLQDMVSTDNMTGGTVLKAEQKITGALSYVNDGKDTIIYFVQGHGEAALDQFTTSKTMLEDANYISKDLNLLLADAVPADASAVAIIAATKDFSDADVAKIDKYLGDGGKLFISMQPLVQTPKIAEVLSKYNITINNDLVIETDNSKADARAPYIFIPSVQETDITKGIVSGKLNVIFPGTRSISVINSKLTDVTITSLAKTSLEAWGEKNLINIKAAKKDPEDLVGPLDLAVSVEKGKTKIVVIGNTGFMAEQYVQSVAGNSELFANSFTWLAERSESINISSKVITSNTFNITSSQVMISLVIVALLPLISIIFGVVVWLRRRHL